MSESYDAYYEAVNNGHTEWLQGVACKDPWCAYLYAIYVKGADIEYCQELACKDPQWAYYFARDVVRADLNICLEVAKDSEWEESIKKIIIKRGIE